MNYGGGIVGLIVLILVIIAIYQIVMSTLDPVKKLIWVVVVLLLPLIGAILWFLIGKKM